MGIRHQTQVVISTTLLLLWEWSGLLAYLVCFVSKCVLWCIAGVLRVLCGVLQFFLKKTVFCGVLRGF